MNAATTQEKSVARKILTALFGLICCFVLVGIVIMLGTGVVYQLARGWGLLQAGNYVGGIAAVVVGGLFIAAMVSFLKD